MAKGCGHGRTLFWVECTPELRHPPQFAVAQAKQGGGRGLQLWGRPLLTNQGSRKAKAPSGVFPAPLPSPLPALPASLEAPPQARGLHS